MSWLLFLDESGHDHKHCPYEVRGGVALHASKLWPFVQRVKQAELEAFGARLHDYKKELKGSKLLDKDRFKWAAQDSELSPEVRQRNSRGFLTKGLEKKPPTKFEFTAYGQASLLMARLVFDALKAMDARVFASVIPASVIKPATYVAQDFLRKDHVFLLERYFYFLEKQNEHGLLVMDEVEKVSDHRFVRQMDKYFSQTATGTGVSRWPCVQPVGHLLRSQPLRSRRAVGVKKEIKPTKPPLAKPPSDRISVGKYMTENPIMNKQPSRSSRLIAAMHHAALTVLAASPHGQLRPVRLLRLAQTTALTASSTKTRSA